MRARRPGRGRRPGSPLFSGSLTAPDGPAHDLAFDEGYLTVYPGHATGPDCAPATWYQVGGWENPTEEEQMFLIFGVPDAGVALFDPSVGLAAWRFDLPAPGPYLRSGVGAVLDRTDDHLLWQVDGGEICTYVGAGDPSCVPQDAPLTVEINGDFADWGEEVEGETGWAVDQATGDEICGSWVL